MIGIKTKYIDKRVIEEFFQLFKTPWGYYNDRQNYDVIITDNSDLSDVRSSLIVCFNSNYKSSSNLTTEKKDEKNSFDILEGNGYFLPVYTGVKAVNGEKTILTINRSGECAVSLTKNKNADILKLGFNIFEEVKYLLLYGQPLENAHLPTLDIHINNLRKWILNAGVTLFEIPPVPYGSNFHVCLTHDVDFVGIKNHKFDMTLAGFIYRALWISSVNFLKKRMTLKRLLRNWLSVVSLPLIFVGIKEDIWIQFKNYVAIEGGVPSTFYFVPKMNTTEKLDASGSPAKSSRKTKYDIAKLKKTVEYLIQNGCEIGVHGIDAWISETEGKSELKKISNLIGRSNVGIRMHWLYLNQQSFKVLEDAGYHYDSTWGYNPKIGFRSGTYQVFKPLQTKKMLELPMHIMDTSLFSHMYMNLTQEQGLSQIKRFADGAAIYGGVLTLNWHHRSLAPERLWNDVYGDAISYFRGINANIATAGQIVEWFKKRRSISFEKISEDEESFSLLLSYGKEKISQSDRIIIRVSSIKNKDRLSGSVSTQDYLNHDYIVDGNNKLTVAHINKI